MQQLILVMIATGLTGGLAGYFFSLDRGTAKQEPSDDFSAKIVMPWLKSIFLGITATFIVPLFLSMAKSDLVSNILNDGPTAPDSTIISSDIFVFAGFCLIAAISSRTFIQSISDRILRVAREARETAEAAKKQAEQAVDSITEPEPEEEPASQVQALAAGESAPAVHVSDGGTKILRALRDRGYTLQSMGGLARGTDLQNQEVIDELNKLNTDGLVRMVPIYKKGKDRIRWMITPAGRDNIS